MMHRFHFRLFVHTNYVGLPIYQVVQLWKIKNIKMYTQWQKIVKAFLPLAFAESCNSFILAQRVILPSVLLRHVLLFSIFLHEKKYNRKYGRTK